MIWGGGILAEVGRARLRRRHRRPQHRGHRGARLGALRRAAQGRRTAARTAFRSSRSAPACCGSAGTASTPAASSASTRRPRSRSSTPTSPRRSRRSPGSSSTGVVSKKPKFLGLLTGAVAGLATITPAAGYVSPATAVLIGIVAGRRLLLRGGAQEPAAAGTTRSTCGACTASAASSASCCSACSRRRAFNPAGADGLLAGNPRFFVKQLGAVAALVGVGVRVHATGCSG